MMPRQATDLRRSELAQIHLAKKQLGLDDATYRAMLKAVCGVASSADLDWRGRAKLLAHLKASGWNKKTRQTGGAHPSLIAKVRALLIAQGRLPDAYADGISKQMFGVERFTWCDQQQLMALIAALNKQAARHQPEQDDAAR